MAGDSRRLADLLGATPPASSRLAVDIRKIAVRRLRAALQGDDDNEVIEALRGAMDAARDSDE